MGGGAQRVPVAPSPPVAQEAGGRGVGDESMKSVGDSFDAHVEELTSELKRMYEQLMRQEGSGGGGDGEGMLNEVCVDGI